MNILIAMWNNDTEICIVFKVAISNLTQSSSGSRPAPYTIIDLGVYNFRLEFLSHYDFDLKVQ
jgi:hypothetical protein